MDIFRKLFRKRHKNQPQTTNSDVDLDAIIPVQSVSKSSLTPTPSNSHNDTNSNKQSQLKRSKSTAIRPKNLTTVMIHVPPSAENINIRSLFGDYDFSHSLGTSSTLSRPTSMSLSRKQSLKELQTSELKGVRWWYDPMTRIIYVEGRSKSKIEKATSVFRERILLAMEQADADVVVYQ